MSLTSELERRDSWVNRFFKERVPSVVNFVRHECGKVKSLNTSIPCESRTAARLVGTAFDYRLRMHFQTDFVSSTGVVLGIDRLIRFGSGHGRSTDRKWAKATVELLKDTPSADLELQAKVSVVLAWLDWGYRSGGRWSGGLRTIAAAVGKGAGPWEWDRYTASIDPSTATEVADIMQLTRFPKAESVVCGVSFDGSRFVGGADADLVLDGCLYDVKTTVTPRDKMPLNLRQVIGYALLDWNDALALKEVGFYFSRQSAWLSWGLRDLVRQTAEPGVTLRQLREEFRLLAYEHNPKLAPAVA